MSSMGTSTKITTGQPKSGAPDAGGGATESRVKGTRVGLVSSDKRSKTRTVIVQFQARHPKYGKYLRKQTVLHVHDENNTSRSGDTVEVVPCRPISKTKQYMLARVIERGQEN